MSDRTVLLTGVPGFIGDGLLRRLVETRSTSTRFVCLVEPRQRDRAERLVETFEPGVRSRITLRDADITFEYLRLGDAYVPLTERVDEVFHLAAAYDLGVDADLAEAVNVDGTEHVLDFAARCNALERFHHMSTCYVSGRYAGAYTEDDVEHNAPFNNAYERSKYAAELDVRDAADDGLDVTVYRPSIVVGDSDTGFTTKYDGLYYLLRLVDGQPPIAVVPKVTDPRLFEFNVVPRDYVVEAISHLSQSNEASGRTFHLCDPHPPSIAELFREVGYATNHLVQPVPTLKRPLTAGLWLLRLFGYTLIEPAALDYLDLPTSYTAANARRELAGTGIDPPPLRSYFDRLVAFMRANPTPPTILAEADLEPTG